jgi:hypothetical protein
LGSGNARSDGYENQADEYSEMNASDGPTLPIEEQRGVEVGLGPFDPSVGEQSQATKKHPMGGYSTGDALTRVRLRTGRSL